MYSDLSFKNKSVLIIDDSETNVLVLKGMLEFQDYTSVSTALSAKEAYKVLEEKTIDIILLDVNMPEINGIEACKTIRAMKSYRNTPLIMVTADEYDETLKNSFDAGANDYVAKPINMINLNSRIKNIFLHKEKDIMLQNQTKFAAMSELIEVLSHHWMEPLADITTTVSEIKNNCKSESADKSELVQKLNYINKIAMELSNSIDEVKQLSKGDNNVLEANINKLVKYALNILRNSCENKNISLQIKESKDLNKILIFPNEFVRVLLNIFINSQEAFLHKNVKTKKIIQVIISQDKKYTNILISDNAGGISKENISKIFDPQYTTKHKKKTAGLGLYNCKQIIEQHQGGQLNITSEKNITNVTIKLLNKNPYIQTIDK